MGWFRKINKNGEDYKPIGNVITATSLSVSGPNLADGDVVRVMFTTDIAGSDTSTPLALTWNGGATPIPVKAMKSGSLVGMYAFEYAANLYRYISAYATLELAYDETNAQFVVVGNPVVLSGSNYTIYADGQKANLKQNEVIDNLLRQGIRATAVANGQQIRIPDYAHCLAIVSGIWGAGSGYNRINTTAIQPNLWQLGVTFKAYEGSSEVSTLRCDSTAGADMLCTNVSGITLYVTFIQVTL